MNEGNQEDIDPLYKEKITLAIQEARKTLWAFCILLFPPQQTTFIWSLLHEFLMDRVQGVFDGSLGKRQAVSVSPQHGKSQILSKIAVAWMLGMRPGITIAITGFSASLVTKFSKDVKTIIAMPMYQLIFPDCKVVHGSDRADEWELTNGSGVLAKSAGSKLTGRKVDWLIIDDPHSGREEAESATMRAKIKQWYFADCLTRLTPGAAVFIIGTRWHPQDLIGHLTSEEYIDEIRDSGVADVEGEIFEVTNIPGLCEDEENDPLGRKIGEAAFPEVRTKDFMEKLKATIPAYEWNSQYQGRPRTAGSGQADTDKIYKILRDDVPEPGIAIWTRGWDLAVGEKKSADYSVGALLAFDKEERHLYIVNIYRKKMAWTKFSGQMEEVIETDIDLGVFGQGIEAVAGFGAIFSQIKKKFLGRTLIVKRNPRRYGKLIRAQPWLNLVEAGKVSMVKGPWNKDFIDELNAFPDGDFDDQIDAVSVGWETIPKKWRMPPKPKAQEHDRSSRPGAAVRPKSRTRILD